VAAYSITFNPLQVIDRGDFERVIKAISVDSIQVFDFQYLIKSDLTLDSITTTISACLTNNSPLFVCLLDTRLHGSKFLEPLVADQVIQVLS